MVSNLCEACGSRDIQDFGCDFGREAVWVVCWAACTSATGLSWETTPLGGGPCGWLIARKVSNLYLDSSTVLLDTG
jgi:hypothetical protein